VAKVGKRLVKEYESEEIVVEWEPRLCFHSGNCGRLLPRVFDREARPWVNVTAASADEIEAAVDHCPSGALRVRRAGRVPLKGIQARPMAKGPLLLRGEVKVYDSDGNLLFEGERAALCRCGGSSNKPFCDGTHKTNGFQG
jgi:uncharacterized Fe-S cluster protein YjdI